MFGWDVDFLEIRLLEYSDLIDEFVVGELNVTHKGVPKPFLLPTLLSKGARLAAFSEKIDYQPISQDVFQRIQDKNKTDQEIVDAMWKIENSQRRDVFHYIKSKYANHTNVYFVQNDGDEMITRAAMAHFSACELRQPDRMTYFPALTFKRNVMWLEQNKHLQRFQMNAQSNMARELIKYLWVSAPQVGPLANVTADEIRMPSWTLRHMGLGSANHFSNPGHPILSFLKHLSVVDAFPARTSNDFWKRAVSGELTFVEMSLPTFRCPNNTAIGLEWVPLYAKREHVIQFVVNHLPWAVRTMTDRYPWLYNPDMFENERLLRDCLCDQREESCRSVKGYY